LSPSGYLAARTILERKERPTAIFVTNCVMAVGALQAIKELGLNIPEDISFISYDDIDMFRVYRPGITAIEQPVEKIAQIISDLMLRRLAEDYEGFPYKATVTSNLILRESVKRL